MLAKLTLTKHRFSPFYARLPAMGCGFFYQEERGWPKIDTRAVIMLGQAREIGEL